MRRLKYGIFETATGRMIEGGFFSKGMAEVYCANNYGVGYEVRAS